jgi:hypothetical protein
MSLTFENVVQAALARVHAIEKVENLKFLYRHVSAGLRLALR